MMSNRQSEVIDREKYLLEKRSVKQSKTQRDY
jgi:hypothetical protein